MSRSLTLSAVFFMGVAVFAKFYELETAFWACLVTSNIYWVGSRVLKALELVDRRSS